MKKLILLLVVVFFSCNFGEINVAQPDQEQTPTTAETILSEFLAEENLITVGDNTIKYSLIIFNNSTDKVEIQYTDFQGNFIGETVHDKKFELLFVPKNLNSKFIFRAESESINSKTIMLLAIRFERYIRVIEIVFKERSKSEVIFDNRYTN